MRSLLQQFFPPLEWGPSYTRKQLYGDLSAGLTVGVMLIPQGMAYALIAGMPPIYGLYASLVPLIIYALMGTSRQLAVGPVAMVSLLVAAGVAPLADGDVDRYIMLSLMLALMVGVLQFGLGLLRFGFLANFLSHPVLSGFTSAAALIIGFSQLKHLLGVDLPQSIYVHEIIWAAVQQAGDIHLLTLAIGVGSIALLLGLRHLNPRLPGPLVVVVIATVMVWAAGGAAQDVSIVGEVPAGLPGLVVPVVDWADVQALAPVAVVISLVGFMESIAVAKVYASQNGYEVDANQELVALGAANIGGAFFQSFPVTGGFSRTAVNNQAGAESTGASLISALLIGGTLLLLTPLFYYMPQAVLAAIVMVAVSGLFNIKEARHLWRTDRKDFGLLVLTFVSTLALGIEEGILVGVVGSLLVVLYQSSRPHTVVMGQLPQTTTYRASARYPAAETRDDVVIVRIDASLYFANANHLKDALRAVPHRTPPPRAVVLDAYPVNTIDSTALHALHELVTELRRQDITFFVAGCKGPVRDAMAKAGFVDHLGEEAFFHEVHEAVRAARAAQQRTGTEAPPTKMADVQAEA